MEGLEGSDGIVIYQLHYIGGKRDGSIVNALRPYSCMHEADGFYAAKEEEPIWLGDFTRKLVLYYRPDLTSFSQYFASLSKQEEN